MKEINKFSLRILQEYSQLIFIIKIIFCAILVFLMGKYTLSLSVPYCILPQFILGALYVHMKELQHETLHGAIRVKSINRFLGILLGLPMLVSYSDYQYHHMLHHVNIGTDKDTEYFTYNDRSNWSYSDVIVAIFMLQHFKIIFTKVFRAILFNKLQIKQEKIRKRITQEYRLIVLIILSIILLACLYNDLILVILKLWLIPLFLFSAPINFLIELPEHVFCEKSTTDIFRNTRTIKSNWLITWFVNGNNYHVEHHYASHYPISALAKLHSEIKTKIVYFDKSYLDFYRSFLEKHKQMKLKH